MKLMNPDAKWLCPQCGSMGVSSNVVAPLCHEPDCNYKVTMVEISDKVYNKRSKYTSDLTFNQVSTINRERANRWHNGFPDNEDGWTIVDWSNAMCGEAGEVANVVKKIRRHDFGLKAKNDPSRSDLIINNLAQEIGDVHLYLDLLAQSVNLSVEGCVVHTFNRVSEREGFPERIW